MQSPVEKTIGTVLRFRKVGSSSVECDCEGGKVLVRAVSPSTIRVRLTTEKSFVPDVSYAIEAPIPSSPLILSSEERRHELRLGTGAMALVINTKAFAIGVVDSSNALVSLGLPVCVKNGAIVDRRRLRSNEDLFALGERVTPMGRRGYKSIMWNVDNNMHHNEATEPMYVSVPFAIGAGPGISPWGYFLDSTYRSDFDLGATDWNTMSVTLTKGELSLYFVCAKSLAEVVKEYTSLTGTHPMPPVWALGYHQCRWSYMSVQEVDEIAHNFRSRKIPCDVLWYDIDYMDNYRVFTFDKKRFAKVKEHYAEMTKLGFRKVVIVDPGVKVDPPGVYNVHDEGLAHNYFIKKPDGKDYVGEVWPGGTKFPDFSHPQAARWWGDLHRRYYDAGVDAFWNDMNEPADLSNRSIIGTAGTLPNDVRMYDDGRQSTMDRMHNAYATLEAKATVGGMLRLRPNDRPFLLTRAGFAGIQKYAAKWCGDNMSTWSHLKASISQVVNMGLSGIGFVGVDVGGFSGNTTPELLARWTQLGGFYPFFRNHSASNTIHQEPWVFGAEIEKICREAIALRYHLIPYYYQLFYEMHKHGTPIMRPLFWHYPGDPKAYQAIDQFMVGTYLLVAPVVERGARERLVYLPKGIWYDYVNGTHYKGGASYAVDAPLDSIPVFVRSGAIIPSMDVVPSTASLDPTQLTLELAIGEKVDENYYEDDMLTNAYKEGARCTNSLHLSQKGLAIDFDKASRLKHIKVRILAPSIGRRTPKGFTKRGVWFEKRFIRKGEALKVEF